MARRRGSTPAIRREDMDQVRAGLVTVNEVLIQVEPVLIPIAPEQPKVVANLDAAMRALIENRPKGSRDKQSNKRLFGGTVAPHQIPTCLDLKWLGPAGCSRQGLL